MNRTDVQNSVWVDFIFHGVSLKPGPSKYNTLQTEKLVFLLRLLRLDAKLG